MLDNTAVAIDEGYRDGITLQDGTNDGPLQAGNSFLKRWLHSFQATSTKYISDVTQP